LDRLNDDELYDIFSRIIDDFYNEVPSVTPSYNSVKIELDCISREAVQDLIAKLLSDYLHDEDREKIENVNAEIGELPSVQPQRKRGKWIAPNTSPSLMMMGIRLCSECNYETQEAGKFCTNCGAEMESDTDDNMDASNNG
jgi:Zn finger protein HypA/HybF involved in hydrogenase expression